MRSEDGGTSGLARGGGDGERYGGFPEEARGGLSRFAVIPVACVLIVKEEEEGRGCCRIGEYRMLTSTEKKSSGSLRGVIQAYF